MIPKRIIVTGARQHLVSSKVKASLQELRARNTDWEMQVFSDEGQLEFIAKNYSPRIVRLYQRINPLYGAARADLFRYLAIYVLGGVYLDIKSTCLHPLNAVLRSDDSLVLSQWDNQIGRPYQGWGLWPDIWDVAGGEYVNWFFAAEARNPILSEVITWVLHQINVYQPTEENVGRQGILRVTGPLAWTRAITEAFRQHRGDLAYRMRIVAPAEAGLVYSIFNVNGCSGDVVWHRHVFKDHYSEKEDPVVLPISENGG